MSCESDMSLFLGSKCISDVNSDIYWRRYGGRSFKIWAVYDGEPLTNRNEETDDDGVEQDVADPDGLAPEILAERFLRLVSLENW